MPDGELCKDVVAPVSVEVNNILRGAHRDMCVKRMRTDFSTLLMAEKGRPSSGAGVHNVREDTTI